MLRGYIYDMLESPTVVAWALLAGGVAILAVERAVTPGDEVGVADLPLRQALGVGFAQCLALVPGVSRSGATLTAGMFLGFDRPSAARYSFLLSVPAVVLSGLFELRKIGDEGGAGFVPTAIATLLAFIVGYATIAFLLRWLTSHSTAIFVAYRVLLGALVIGLTAAGAIS
jgi:undecaprenyl-diphosphatase